jgi:hypothetical protein
VGGGALQHGALQWLLATGAGGRPRGALGRSMCERFHVACSWQPPRAEKLLRQAVQAVQAAQGFESVWIPASLTC